MGEQPAESAFPVKSHLTCIAASAQAASLPRRHAIPKGGVEPLKTSASACRWPRRHVPGQARATSASKVAGV